MGQESLADDPRFLTDQLRGDNGDALNAIVQQWRGARSSADCVEQLSAAGLCAAPVLSPAETLAHPQVKDATSLHYVRYPEGDIDVPTFLPMEVNGQPAMAPSPAPRLGAHSGEILQELGYTSAAAAALFQSGVVSRGAED